MAHGAKLIAASGHRYHHAATDTQKGSRHIPILHNIEDIFSAIPYDCAPVGVDLVPNACPLHQFNHPPSAFYLFGPEDGTLGKIVLDRCAYRVYVQTNYCMNLAAAVNVVLYDRNAKLLKQKDYARGMVRG